MATLTTMILIGDLKQGKEGGLSEVLLLLQNDQKYGYLD